MKETIGRRIDLPSDTWIEGNEPYKPGDYWKNESGHWNGCTPNGILCNLSRHEVKENNDGTITVNPSILVWGGESEPRWHGYLVVGVWKEC